jgi:hypothetical protein
MCAPMLRFRNLLVMLFACVIVALSGCGGNEGVSFERGGPPAPRACLDRWNEDKSATTFGSHAYLSHDSRAAQVTRVAEGEGRPRRGCAVVFAVAESDREYGTVGKNEPKASAAANESSRESAASR